MLLANTSIRRAGRLPRPGNAGRAILLLRYFASSLSASMRVMDVQGAGQSAKLQEVSAPLPKLGPDDVLIKVHAAGVNRPDLLQKRGLYPAPPGSSPYLGLEVAGEVAAVGPAVAKGRPGLALGRRVMALTNGGGYAQYVAVPYAQLMATPMSMGDVAAAAAMETLLTTWYNVIQLGGLQRGSALLVHGATGGIGSMALRLGAAAGARAVIGTAGSAHKAQLGTHLGAHIAIDYSTAEFDQVLTSDSPVREFVRGKISHQALYDAAGSVSGGGPVQLQRGVWIAPPRDAEEGGPRGAAFGKELSVAHRGSSALWEGLGPHSGGVGPDAGLPGTPSRDGCNVVLDVVGGSYLPRNMSVLGTAGRHVSIAFQQGSKVPPNMDFMRVMLKRLVLTGSTLRSRSPHFKGSLVQHIAVAVQRHQLLHSVSNTVASDANVALGAVTPGASSDQWRDAAPLAPFVGGVNALERAEDAHSALEEGAPGKQVLTVSHDE